MRAHWTMKFTYVLTYPRDLAYLSWLVSSVRLTWVVGCCSQVLDLRKNEQVSTLSGHTDTPTSLALSPNGSFLLSPSLSSQTIIHDVRPFSPTPNRVHRVLAGAPAGFENTLLRGSWSKNDDGKRVGVGGADRTVCIWDVDSGKVLYKVRTRVSVRRGEFS